MLPEPGFEIDATGTGHTGFEYLVCHTSRIVFSGCRRSRSCFCRNTLSGRSGKPVAVRLLACATSCRK